MNEHKKRAWHLARPTSESELVLDDAAVPGSMMLLAGPDRDRQSGDVHCQELDHRSDLTSDADHDVPQMKSDGA